MFIRGLLLHALVNALPMATTIINNNKKKYMVVVLGKIRQLSIILPEYVWITYEGLKFTPHVTTIKDLHFLFSKMTHLEIYLYTYMYTQTIIKQLLTTSCITERTQ